MTTIDSLIDSLLERPSASVEDAGKHLLDHVSGSRLTPADFLSDPLALIGPPFFASRYLAQVALRALKNEYETLDELVSSLGALLDRNPPIIEPKRQALVDRVVLPAAKVIEVNRPVRTEDGHWKSSVDLLVTSGALRGREIRISLRSDENRIATFLVSYLWVHSTIAGYNLVPTPDGGFAACAETFLVIEPVRQVNATSIARSLHCTKPQVDQTRRGKGDVTIHTLKGQLIHLLFDRMLEGSSSIENAYEEALPSLLVPLASVVDDFFDESAFRADVNRHTSALKEFVHANPHLLEHTQLELKRHSATIGIQGRIDALYRHGNRLDILELKTGAKIRPEDHAQLFIYRLLLSDLIRRWRQNDGSDVEVSSRLLSSVDGSFAPLRVTTDFHQVLDARNKLVALQYALGQYQPHVTVRFEGFNEEICNACPSWTRSRCKDASDVFGDRPGCPETEELRYFRRFTRLVQRERWRADEDLGDLLDDSRLDFRVRNFRAIRGARIAPGADCFTFEFERNTSDLERGDSVLIHSGMISSSTTYHGHIRDIDTHSMRVAIPLKNLHRTVFEGREWIIDRFPGDVTSEASHTALYDFLIAPMDAKKRAILGESAQSPKLPADFPSRGTLNDSQTEAVNGAVGCDVFHLIWGPPGTGKTRVIPEIVREVKGPILLGAFTNTAVDKMLGAMLDRDPSFRFLRVGRSSESPELASRLNDPGEYFTEDLALRTGTVRAMKQLLDTAPVVAATAHRASTIPYLRTRAFEMAIVDEAGQLTEPLTLGLILRARRFVLIGDDKQLPPVVRTKSLGLSMFERLKRDGRAITMLDTQYRMHSEIMDLSNRFFYEGRLRPGVADEERTPPDGRPVVFIPVEGECDGRSNRSEADVVCDLVRSYLNKGVSPASIGVVSPFRAQVVLLRHLLGGVGVMVDTVERFQGGERDIMILSFVRARSAGFAFDERRLNVAITRARRKLILVGQTELFRNSRYSWICTFTETLKTAGVI